MTVSSPNDRKKIKDAMHEISNAMTRIESERALIKDIKSELHEQFKEQLTRKEIAKMARVYHKQNFDEEVTNHEKFEALYEEIMGPQQ